MKQHPILFSTPMVQAILEGRKTQTRRIVKPRSQEDYALMINMEAGINIQESIDELIRCSCPYGKVGDVLYVRESHYRYGKWVKNGTTKTGKQKWKFIADNQFPNFRYQDDVPAKIQKNSDRVTGWYKRSSLFMPKEFTRIYLEITDIRVERLQDISEEDAVAEGIEVVAGKIDDNPSFRNYLHPDKAHAYGYPKNSFQSLWESINGVESWNQNPWLWAITFKRIEKP